MSQDQKRPLVSIITPTLNSERYIRDNVRSVLSQTYPNIEHIIIDGGSTDNTVAIVREMDPKAIIISEPDEGIADAFNKGLKLAKGDIVAILNSDDYYADGKVIEKVVKAFVTKPDVKVIYGIVRCIDLETGKTISFFGKPCTFIKRRATISSISHPAFFAKLEVYKKIGFFSLKYKCAMDLDYFLRVVRFYKPDYFNEVLTVMRWGGFGAKNIFLGHRETYKILHADGMNTAYAIVDFLHRYFMTVISIVMQKIGLKKIIYLYRDLKGRR